MHRSAFTLLTILALSSLGACAGPGYQSRAAAARAASATVNPPKAPSQLARNDANDPVICQNETKTGSHMQQRVCRRRSEIAERARLDREAMARIGNGSGRAGSADPSQ